MIDAEKRAAVVTDAPFVWDTSRRKGEQFQGVTVPITELERCYASGVIR